MVETIAIEHGLEDEGKVVGDGASIFNGEGSGSGFALSGDRVVDGGTIRAMGNDFAFNEVKVFGGFGVEDEEPLIRIAFLHLGKGENCGFHGDQ
jgi:hypothetical protein